MEAGVRDLRDNLSRYLSLVGDGQEITVTDHGKAVAVIIPIGQARPLDRLIADGIVVPATTVKQRRSSPRVKGAGTVSDLVAEQRQ
jgi:prevent-host-death family protein